MTTLRVLVPDPPDGDAALAWARYDETGRRLDRGTAPRDGLPRADAIEAVLAADATRIVALRLPPMPAARRASAAAYALEDRLAATPEQSALLVDAPRADGVTLARIASRASLETLARARPPFARVIAEPDLAPARDAWRWCARAGGGFVRRSDGSSFAVGPIDADALPAELALALAQAAREGAAPQAIDVEAPCTEAQCRAWSAQHGAAFRAKDPWDWTTSTAFAAAPDLRAALAPPVEPRAGAGVIARAFVPALALVALALALHLLATAGTWIARKVELARTERAIAEAAAQAGVRDAAVGDAWAALVREYVRRRHEAGLAAPGDALPSLARIAMPLAALPDGALKSATYSGATWTLDLLPLDEAATTRLVRALAQGNVSVVHARQPSGLRVRVGPLR